MAKEELNGVVATLGHTTAEFSTLERPDAKSVYFFDAPRFPLFWSFSHCRAIPSSTQIVRQPRCTSGALYSLQLRTRYSVFLTLFFIPKTLPRTKIFCLCNRAISNYVLY